MNDANEVTFAILRYIQQMAPKCDKLYVLVEGEWLRAKSPTYYDDYPGLLFCANDSDVELVIDLAKISTVKVIKQ